MDRTFDVIVLGATGFTGALVAEHLLERYGAGGGGLRWALAGRNPAKLEAVRSRLAERWPDAGSLPLVVADSHDPVSLAALAEQTRVVCTTVGPYLQHGAALVAACVEAGTHYCDLTGETPFIRAMIDAHHAGAQANGCRIVHCCGFDSIPSDLGCLVLQDAAMNTLGRQVETVRFATGVTKGGFSGGTVASMVGIIDAVRSEPAVRRVLFDPYSLDPHGDEPGTDGPDSMAVAWSDAHDQWTAPFIMAGINTRVVRRSHALLGRPWGASFSYTEVMGCGRGVRGWLRAHLLRVGIGALTMILASKILRSLVIGPLLPEPGQGPSRAEREAGYFGLTLIGSSGEDAVRVRVSGEGDPGYLATSRMLGESAVSLALDTNRLPDRAGVLTPATAMGQPLVDRLATVGIHFEVG